MSQRLKIVENSTPPEDLKFGPNIENSIPYWITAVELPQFAELQEEISSEVCVIGGGIVGLTSAYFLARQGIRVAIIDASKKIGLGQSGRTTAHLTYVLSTRYKDLQKTHGKEIAAGAARSHADAIDRIELIVQKENIECDFHRCDGYLQAHSVEANSEILEEYKACQELGMSDVELVDQLPFSNASDLLCLRFPKQAELHSTKYLAGLTKVLEKLGVRIYSDTKVVEVDSENSSEISIRTSNGFYVFANFIVMATHIPILTSNQFHYTTLYPTRSYAFGAWLPKGEISRNLVWDTASPFHYARIQSVRGAELGLSTSPYPSKWDRNLLIVGGGDHRTGITEDSANRLFSRLELWARKLYPEMGNIAFRWSGQIIESVDGLARIGELQRNSDRILFSSGDGGNGFTYSVIAAQVFSEKILKRTSLWGNSLAKMYHPRRFRLHSGANYIKQNVSTAKQYFKPKALKSEEGEVTIPLDGGAITKEDSDFFAVYRDGVGVLHKFSATCPHLGAVVKWNSLEKTWDCPCHGSRFTKLGKCINGPATENLKSLPRDIFHAPSEQRTLREPHEFLE